MDERPQLGLHLARRFGRQQAEATTAKATTAATARASYAPHSSAPNVFAERKRVSIRAENADDAVDADVAIDARRGPAAALRQCAAEAEALGVHRK